MFRSEELFLYSRQSILKMEAKYFFETLALI